MSDGSQATWNSLDRPKISIVVPYYNCPELLDWFLEPLRRENAAGPFELILVDDCSEVPPPLALFSEVVGPVHVLRLKDRVPWSMSTASN